MPASLKRRIRIFCVEKGLEMSRLVEDAVRERLAAAPRHPRLLGR